MKAASISRLELYAAQLGVQWWLQIHKALRKEKHEITFWTDSKNVLYWLNNPAKHFKVFVAYRVGEIQEHSHPRQWRHVSGSENPADIPSRGLSVKDLLVADRFYRGFLTSPKTSWPETRLDFGLDNMEEREQKIQAFNNVVEESNIWGFICPRASVGDIWNGWNSSLRRMSLLLRIQVC